MHTKCGEGQGAAGMGLGKIFTSRLKFPPGAVMHRIVFAMLQVVMSTLPMRYFVTGLP